MPYRHSKPLPPLDDPLLATISVGLQHLLHSDRASDRRGILISSGGAAGVSGLRAYCRKLSSSFWLSREKAV